MMDDWPIKQAVGRVSILIGCQRKGVTTLYEIIFHLHSEYESYICDSCRQAFKKS